jgi:cobalt-precorrin-5B (C1)-methyltransferase
MRHGYATSACAAAAATAALRRLLTGQAVDEIEIRLPSHRQARFALYRCETAGQGVLCGVIKDAGDDPDVTNGLEVQALVEQSAAPGIRLLGGTGIGVVTLPGLPCPVGEPAINPGPRRLIRQILLAELERLEAGPDFGCTVTIRVPEGERVAVETMNPKLGIVGGISILGTDGIVRPYSAPAFRASIYYEMNVARQAGYTTIGLTTGKRSAAYLRSFLNDDRGLGVLDVGDELDYPLQLVARLGFDLVILGGMVGKFSKMAQGRFQTHVKEGEVDFDFLSEVAANLGAAPELCERIRTARTAHQVRNWLQDRGLPLEPELAQRAVEQVAANLDRRISVSGVVFSLQGELLAKASFDAAPGMDGQKDRLHA